MTVIDEARNLIKNHPIPDTLQKMGEEDIGSYGDENARLTYYDGDCTAFLCEDMNGEVLAKSFSYVISADKKKLTKETDLKLGTSKYKGLPHLPDSFKWPEGQYFLAQINLAELHSVNLEAGLPSKGMLYLFFDTRGDCSVKYYGGPVDSLKITEYPSPDSLPSSEHYLDEFKTESASITFKPGYIFYVGGDVYDYEDIAEKIPADLREKLDTLLKCNLLTSDSDTRTFGRPIYWQGEDELPEELKQLPPEQLEEMGIDIGSGEPKLLLFQDEFGEGHIHFWQTKASAESKDFEECWVTYSGT